MTDKQFSEHSHLSDAVLVVEEKRLHVNKAVLSLASPVFDRMFHGEFKEGKTGEIPLPGKKYDHFVEFLSCIYPSSDKTVTPENMDFVMPLAEEYQVSFIKELCDTLIETIFRIEKIPATSKLVHLMYVAGKFGLPKSMKKCADVASTRKLSDLQKVKEFEQVNPEVKYEAASKILWRYEDGCFKLEQSLGNLRVFNKIGCSHSDRICQMCKSEDKMKIIQQLNSFHN